MFRRPMGGITVCFLDGGQWPGQLSGTGYWIGMGLVGIGWQGVEDTEHLGRMVLSGPIPNPSWYPPCSPALETVSLAAVDHGGEGSPNWTPINLGTPW